MNGTRILFISHEASLTGAPVILLSVIRYLVEQHEVRAHIVIREPNGESLIDAFRELGPVTQAWLPGTTELPAEVDIIYSNTVTNGIFIDRLPYHGVPVLTHVHEMSESIHYFGSNNFRSVCLQTSYFIACSQSVRNHLVHNFNIPSSRVCVVPEFVDLDRVEQRLATADPLPSHLERELGGAFVIGGCGWASRRKGTDLFAEMANNFPRSVAGRHVKWVWTGGNAEAFLDPLTARRTPAVVQAGLLKNPFALYRRCNAFALTSREDPFPLVMLEHAYLGCPVVGFSGSGGVDELAARGAAIVVPPLDLERFASSLMLLLVNRCLHARIARQGRDLVSSDFNLNVCLPKIATAVTAALTSRDAPIPATAVPGTFPIRSIYDGPRSGTLTLYFGYDCGQHIEVNFDRFEPALLRVPVPVAEPLVIRLDPDHTAGTFHIKKLRLHGPHSPAIWTAGRDCSWDSLRVTGTATRLSVDEGISILSYGEDPHIWLPELKLPKEVTGPIMLEILMLPELLSTRFAKALQEHCDALRREVPMP